MTRRWCSASGMFAMGKSAISRVRESGQQADEVDDIGSFYPISS
jgi:hypothetical protein